MKSTKKKTKQTVRVSKTTLEPLTQIPQYAQHRFFWYLGMIIFGKANAENKKLEAIYDDAYSHMKNIKDNHFSGNTWDETIKRQLAAAYRATKGGKNNLYPKLSSSEDGWYEFDM
jgi:hypothetical protein